MDWLEALRDFAGKAENDPPEGIDMAAEAKECRAAVLGELPAGLADRGWRKDAASEDGWKALAAEAVALADGGDADAALALVLAATFELGAPREIVADWTAPAPARDWLIPDWLPLGRVGILTGMGARGKSRLMAQLCSGMAQPNVARWLPMDGPELATADAQTAVFSSWEDESAELRRWLHDANCAAHVGDRLRFVAPPSALWAPVERGGHVATMGEFTAAWRWLAAYCEKHRARLLVLDPRAAAYATSEIDRSLVRAFMARLDGWAQAARCSVMLVSHPAKADRNAEEPSGSGDWWASARTVWTLNQPDTSICAAKDGKGKAMLQAPQLACPKASYSKRPDPHWLRFVAPWWETADEHAAARAHDPAAYKRSGAASGATDGGGFGV